MKFLIFIFLTVNLLCTAQSGQCKIDLTNPTNIGVDTIYSNEISIDSSGQTLISYYGTNYLTKDAKGQIVIYCMKNIPKFERNIWIYKLECLITYKIDTNTCRYSSNLRYSISNDNKKILVEKLEKFRKHQNKYLQKEKHSSYTSWLIFQVGILSLTGDSDMMNCLINLNKYIGNKIYEIHRVEIIEIKQMVIDHLQNQVKKELLDALTRSKFNVWK